MYNLKITGLSAQRDMSSLVKVLLKIPGLTPSQVSSGLKIYPFNVLSAEKEEDAQKLKSTLEKLGAICAIESENMPGDEEEESKATNPMEAYLKQRRRHSRKFRRNFWISIILIAVAFAFISNFDFSCENKHIQPSQPKVQTAQNANMPDGAPQAKLKKNPYNVEAWKNLAESLEKQGDTASARKAWDSYEKSVKVQQVLASLAKAFGNGVRVEIREDAIFYRTSYDFTDDEFYAESAKLMNSLSEKFPGKDLIIENYTSDNRVQSVEIKSTIKPK